MNHARVESPLTMGKHFAVTGTRAFFGALTGAIRLFRGSHPPGWRTLRYGIHREEILDHRPADEGTVARAPVVFFHGGGWMMGTKDFYSHDLMFLTAAGFPVFNVEYPKAPEQPHPWILRSVLKSLAFVKRMYPEAAEVHLVGDSAGGNLAVMAGLLAQNPKLIAAVEPLCDPKSLPRVRSVTSLYGVLDRATCLESEFPGGAMVIEAYGGAACLQAEVDAAHAITPMDLSFRKHPPCLLVCGARDPLLPSTELYAARLAREGHEHAVKIYADSTHAFFNFPEGIAKDTLQRDLAAFLIAHS